MVVYNQLRWRCRRGTQELDRLLLGFLENAYPRISPQMQQTFQDFLEMEDSCLQHYLLGDAIPERHDFQLIVSLMQSSDFAKT